MAAQSRSDRRSNTVQREWLRSRRKKETGKRKKDIRKQTPYNGNGLWLKSSALTNLFVGSRSANRAGRRRLVNKTPRRRWKAIISERLAANPVETIYLRRSWKNRWSITAVTIAPPRPGTPIISALRQHRHILSIHPDSIWFTRAYPERERENRRERERQRKRRSERVSEYACSEFLLYARVTNFDIITRCYRVHWEIIYRQRMKSLRRLKTILYY